MVRVWCRAWTSSLEIQGKWNRSEQGKQGWAGAAEQRHSKEPPALVTQLGEGGGGGQSKVDMRWGRGCRAQLLKHLYLVGRGSRWSPLGKSLEAQ